MGELFGAALGFYFMAMIFSWGLGKATSLPEPRRVAWASFITIAFATIAATYGNADLHGVSFQAFLRSYLVYAQGGFWFLLTVFFGKVKE